MPKHIPMNMWVAKVKQILCLDTHIGSVSDITN